EAQKEDSELWSVVQIMKKDLSFAEEPEAVLDRQERVMRKKTIPLVKVHWKNHPEREATWENEEMMRTFYPHFFSCIGGVWMHPRQLPTLTARITDEIRQNENNENNGNRRNTRRINTEGSGNDGNAPPTDIHVWLERFQKQKPQTFSSASTPVEAENWITHIEKIFEVLGCGDQFKARLATYKLEGDAHSWWRSYKQAKGGDTYAATLPWNDFVTSSFCSISRTLRKKSVNESTNRFEERAKHFKWGLNDFILDKILNIEFTDVAQVANAARNVKIFRDRPKNEGNNKRDRDGHRIRPSDTPAQGSNQRAYDRRDSDRYGNGGRYGNKDRYGNNGGRSDRQGSDKHGNGSDKRDYASSPSCTICGKLHPGKACHRATGACFECGEVGHLAKDCKKGSTSSKGNKNNKPQATSGRVFALTTKQAGNAPVTFSKHLKVPPIPLDNALSLSTPMRNNVIISHQFRNCPLSVGEDIRFANLLPLEISDFDIILGMD
nr:hypothetical protein [Tanacetum cinerariifolium]